MSKQRIFINNLATYFAKVPNVVRKRLYVQVENKTIESGWQLKRNFNRTVIGYSMDANTANLVYRDIKRHQTGACVVKKKQWKEFIWAAAISVITMAVVGVCYILYTAA